MKDEFIKKVANLLSSTIEQAMIDEASVQFLKEAYGEFCMHKQHQIISKENTVVQKEFLAQFSDFLEEKKDRELTEHRAKCTETNCQFEKLIAQIMDFSLPFVREKKKLIANYENQKL